MLARAAALIAGLGDTGPVSAPYANRRGPGFRLYLDLYLPDTDDAPAGPGRRDGGFLMNTRTTAIPPRSRWQNAAACRPARTGPVWADLFAAPDSDIPESKQTRQEREQVAKKVCAACPVRAARLADALTDGDPHTVRGGMTPDERFDLRRTAA
ncbi:WhiB family transcriptional regulator [Yinghuangia aomiensis]